MLAVSLFQRLRTFFKRLPAHGRGPLAFAPEIS
jgi:hypothetical protein